MRSKNIIIKDRRDKKYIHWAITIAKKAIVALMVTVARRHRITNRGPSNPFIITDDPTILDITSIKTTKANLIPITTTMGTMTMWAITLRRCQFGLETCTCHSGS